MIVRKMLHGAAGAALFAAGMLATTASSAQADCRGHAHTGRGTGLLRATAGLAARADWRHVVRRHDGPEYTRWSRARGRVTSCQKPESGRWHCIARARACSN
ncbi:MAG: hypothetical protein K2X43_13025 [Hyphomonadaceae bacterium]|nr:hypothetical protein [Hyphomonadaceae bacterium]